MYSLNTTLNPDLNPPAHPLLLNLAAVECPHGESRPIVSVDTHHMTDISELNVDNMTVKLQVCKRLALMLYSCNVLLLYSSSVLLLYSSNVLLCCAAAQTCGRIVTVL